MHLIGEGINRRGHESSETGGGGEDREEIVGTIFTSNVVPFLHYYHHVVVGWWTLFCLAPTFALNLYYYIISVQVKIIIPTIILSLMSNFDKQL